FYQLIVIETQPVRPVRIIQGRQNDTKRAFLGFFHFSINSRLGFWSLRHLHLVYQGADLAPGYRKSIRESHQPGIDVPELLAYFFVAMLHGLFCVTQRLIELLIFFSLTDGLFLYA